MELDTLTKEKLIELLWNELREVACVTKQNAHRIVVVHKSDIVKLVDRVKP